MPVSYNNFTAEEISQPPTPRPPFADQKSAIQEEQKKEKTNGTNKQLYMLQFGSFGDSPGNDGAGANVKWAKGGRWECGEGWNEKKE